MEKTNKNLQKLAKKAWRIDIFKLLALERLGERRLKGRGGVAVECGRVVPAAQRAIGARAARLEQRLELAAGAVRRLADIGELVGLAVDRDRHELAREAVEVLVELHQPVRRRLHVLHQLVPCRAVGVRPQRVEQKHLLLGVGRRR